GRRGSECGADYLEVGGCRGCTRGIQGLGSFRREQQLASDRRRHRVAARVTQGSPGTRSRRRCGRRVVDSELTESVDNGASGNQIFNGEGSPTTARGNHGDEGSIPELGL